MSNFGCPRSAVFAFAFCMMNGEKTFLVWKGWMGFPSAVWRKGQKCDALHSGTTRHPEQFVDLIFSAVRIISFTGGQAQQCSPSQDWANASTPSHLGE